MIPDYTRSYKGYLISKYTNTGCWAITKTIPGRFFEKTEHIATLYSERSCVEFIDTMAPQWEEVKRWREITQARPAGKRKT
jgi:hypothetical protein